MGWIGDRWKAPAVILSLTHLCLGAYVIWSLYIFESQPEFFLRFAQEHGLNWHVMMTARFLITLKFLFVPTVLMGFSFTQASRALRQTCGASESVAGVYAFNTIGDILGAFFAGFFILPWFGIERSLFLMAWMSMGVALYYVIASRSARSIVVVSLAAAALLGVSFWHPPHWNEQLLGSGPYFSPAKYISGGDIRLRQQIQSERLLFYREGVTATVSVSKMHDEHLYFAIDGKVEADNLPRGMVIQRMIGHLPMLLHPNPKRVMNLGLGAGVTLGALSCYPVEHLEVVEIEPAVLEGLECGASTTIM